MSLTLSTHRAEITYDVDVSAAAVSLTLSTNPAEIGLNVDVSALPVGLLLSTYPAVVLLESSVEDGLFIYDHVGWTWIESVNESAEFSEAVEVQMGWSVTDWMAIRETIGSTWNYNLAVIDSLHVVGEAVLINLINEAVTSTIDITDAATFTHSIVAAVTDTFGISEDVAAQMLYNPSVVESMAIAGAVSFIKQLNLAVEETIDITDALQFVWNESVTDSLQISDAADMIYYCMIVVADAIDISDTPAMQLLINESVSDSMAFSAAVAMQQIFNLEVEDGFELSISVRLDDELWECWVLNTNAFHASVYSGFDFNSYAVCNDSAYAAKEGGIYRLDGDTDDGAAINTGIVLPETAFGTSRQKRFRKAYFGISGTSPAVRLETESGSRTYTIQSSKADISRSQKGREWTLKLQGFDDVDFIELVPIILKR